MKRIYTTLFFFISSLLLSYSQSVFTYSKTVTCKWNVESQAYNQCLDAEQTCSIIINNESKTIEQTINEAKTIYFIQSKTINSTTNWRYSIANAEGVLYTMDLNTTNLECIIKPNVEENESISLKFYISF